jgi:hypothetical protein
MTGGERIFHDGVIGRVAGAVTGAGMFLRAGAESMMVEER